MSKIQVLRHAILMAMLFGSEAASQAPDTSLAKQMRLDLAVPGAPAMLLVGGDNESVLRPGTMHSLAVSFKDFNGSSGFQLPASFGIEVAPLLLLPRFDTDDYTAWAPVARLRVSVGTHRGDEEGSATSIGLGLRTSVHNGADLRTNSRYRSTITPYLARIGNLEDSINYATKARCPDNTFPPCDERPPTPEEVAARITAYRTTQKLIADSLESIRARYVDSLWNAPMFDIAVATAQQAADSTGRDPQPAVHSVWASYSNGFGTTYANFVVGGQLSWRREDRWGNTLSGGVRLYIGRNLIKGFVEAGYGDGTERDRVLGGGGELKVLDGVYATLSAAWEEDADGRERLRARFNLRTSPENTRE